jgi:mannosyltransferase
MATYASRPTWELGVRAVRSERLAVPLGIGLLLAASVLLRTRQLDVGYWIDEGLSVGIADRPLADIPGALRMDGSPPLYYVLLHGWLALAGAGEEATHALSLLFALLCVPVAFWGGRVLFGPRTAWIAAVLTAVNPFLTQYAQETRMYSLIALLGLVASVCFVRSYAVPAARRAWPVGFAVALAAMLYTHNWGLFFGLTCGLTWVALLARGGPGDRRRLLRDGLIGFGGALVLFAPWLPTLLFQAAHTGAPWSKVPPLERIGSAFGNLLGPVAVVALVLAGGSGLAALLSRRRAPEARTAVALIALALGTLLVAWLASQLSPAWAARYLVVALPPLLLLCAAGLAHAGRLGLAGLLLVAVLWAADGAPAEKSNVREVAEAVAPGLRAGDLIVSTQPEQVPVLHHYLPDGLRYATLTGPVEDPGVADWRDGVERLEATSPARDLQPLLDSLAPAQRLVLVTPIVFDKGRWTAPWTTLVRLRSEEWEQYLSNDPRLRISAVYPPRFTPPRPNPVRATVLVRAPLAGA